MDIYIPGPVETTDQTNLVIESTKKRLAPTYPILRRFTERSSVSATLEFHRTLNITSQHRAK